MLCRALILAILIACPALSFAQAPAAATVSPDRINHGTTITGLSPSSALAGGSGFVLTVRGFPFYNGVKVRWNGTDRPTTYVGIEELRATISDNDIAKAGSAQIVVWEPDGFVSATPMTFSINNPAPLISKLSPPAIASSDKNFTLSLTGTNFVPNSDVKWNGQSRDVTFHNSSLITATILASDIANPGQATLTVVNSAPGGGTSNPAGFVTYAPGPPLVFPRLVSKDGSPTGEDSSEYTGIAVANLGSSKSTLLFTVYDAVGEPIQGTGITNPKFLDLNASQQLPLVDSQIFGAGLSARESTGWIQLNSTAGKIAGFFLMFNRSLSILDGVDISDVTLNSFVFPEVEDQGFTKLHCANPNSGPVTLTLTLVSFNGSERAPAVERMIAGHGVLTESISGLFPGVSPAGSDYIRVTSTAGVVPFEVLGKTGQYIEGLRGQSTTSIATTSTLPSTSLAVPTGEPAFRSSTSTRGQTRSACASSEMTEPKLAMKGDSRSRPAESSSSTTRHSLSLQRFSRRAIWKSEEQ